MSGRCYEDFEAGMGIRHPLGRTISSTDNTWFTLLTVNTNPIHFDAHYAAQTEFGKPLVNSTLTLAIVTGCCEISIFHGSAGSTTHTVLSNMMCSWGSVNPSSLTSTGPRTVIACKAITSPLRRRRAPLYHRSCDLSA